MRKIRDIIFVVLCLYLVIICGADVLPTAYAASEMKASDACINFIKEVEGFSKNPYYDYNQYTVGYGTKCPAAKFSDYTENGISKKEAEKLLKEELSDLETAINQKLIEKYNLTFTQHQFDALVSFSFNIGPGWMTYDSTLRNAILKDAGESDMVYAFSLYCTAGGKYLPGLVTRRLCEANIFVNGVYSQKKSADYGYVYYDAAGGNVTYRVQGYVCDSKSAPALSAVRNGDVFLGWYTELNGGTQVAELTSALNGKTLFAQWQSSENTEDQQSVAITVKVTGDVVNIRSGPGTNYGLLKQVPRNTVLTVSHVTHLTNMKWGKVQNGWICLDYTNYDAVVNGSGKTDTESNEDATDKNTSSDQEPDTDESKESSTIISGTVNVNDFLRVRSGPGTTYTTVGFLFNGNKVRILEQKTAESKLWGRFADGWVCMDYIRTGESDASGTNQEPEKKPEKEIATSTEKVSIQGTITADALRIRSEAGTSGSIVGFYYQNDRVVISERVSVGFVYWGKTGKGWISMDYVLTDSSAGDTQSGNDGEKTVIADCLRIRKDAGTTHKIVGFLYDGDTIKVTETKTVDGTAWGRVSGGWICMDYVI